MSLRNVEVSELDSWTDGSLTSIRQADGSSCGLFVLLVNIIYIPVYWLSIVITFKVCSILSVNTIAAFVHCL